MTVQATKCKTPFQVALEAAGMKRSARRLELAVQIGVDSVTVWRWLTGRSVPRGEGIRRAIAQALEKTTDELWPANIDREAA